MVLLEDFLGINYPRIFHLTVTGRCNASCEGCINSLIYGDRKGFFENWETDPERDIKLLTYLITYENTNPLYIAFYGGEPLLSFEKLKIIMYNLKQKFTHKPLNFILYTNGLLIDKYLLKERKFFAGLNLLIVSIDGREKQHNTFRKGTDLKKIEENLELLKREVKIPVLMWSTIRENMSLLDCFEEFLSLYKECKVSYFFWHLLEGNEPIKDFEKFKRTYLKNLQVIIEVFLNHLSNEKILPLLPICELIFFLMQGIRRGHTACGVEKLRNFDIQGGKILPCADYGEEIILGKISKENGVYMDKASSLEKLKSLVLYKNYFGCKECQAEFYCGGRCPVLIKTSPLRAKQYCILTKEFVRIVQEKWPEILKIFKDLNLDPKRLYFPYGYTTLLTDVIP